LAEAAVAPAPAAPSAPAPVGESITDSSAETHAPAAPDKITRLARPLKPIPSLPGVDSDEDPFPSLPPSRTAATSAPATPGQPTRGPDGRFVAPSSAADGTGVDALEAAADSAADPKPQSAKFKFAGEEFASQHEAEQNFRSLRGQFKPITSLARSLGGVDKIIPQFQSAAESARGWKAEADRLAAELASVRNGQPVGASTATTAPDADAADAEPTIDWGLYAEIRQLADQSGEPWKAEQWLAEQQDAIIQARVQRILDKRLAPLADAEAAQSREAQTANLFGSLAEYTNSDGSVAFPELHDEAAAYEVGKMWASLGLPPEAALTPQGAVAAIAVYRMARGNRSQASPAAPPSAIPSRLPGAPTDARAAADLGDGRVRELSVPEAGSPSADAARILSGLRQANSGNRSLLGFDA
jgi:hypothetical protein